jgi:tRNA (guanine37-N1)-methyltransferase
MYTKPAVFRDMPVPEVLLSGNHAKIRAWRQEQSLAKTTQRRPDILSKDAD